MTEEKTPLDDTEKYGIITDEELEEIGVAYGSRERYEESLRNLALRLSGAQRGRTASVPGGIGKTQARIESGTTTVPLGNLSEVKNTNIVGKVINTPGDAAQVLSAFRDPRIEIFNIVYTSKTGEILAHTAWTSGLPGRTVAVDGDSADEGISKIIKIKETLGADKIWISHNHPTGNPKPSEEDVSVTRNYSSRLGNGFAGHIVVDGYRYYFITPEGITHESELGIPVKDFNSKTREQSETIRQPVFFVEIFNEILKSEEDTTVCAVVDGQNKIVSWTYLNSDNSFSTTEIKDYMRISGGASVVVLSNSEDTYRNFYNAACDVFSAKNAKNAIYLDVIKVNPVTGFLQESFAEKNGIRNNWQVHEAQGVKYIVNNQPIIQNKEQIMETNEKTTVQEDGPSFLSDEFEELERKASRMNDFLIYNIGFLPANNEEADEAIQMLKQKLKVDFNIDKSEAGEYTEIIERLKFNLVNNLVNEKAEKQKDGSFFISKEKLDEIEESFESISRRDIILKISRNNKEIFKGSLFYNITENKDGGYTYHEFTSGWSGTRAIETNNLYRDFKTQNEASLYALQRGAVDAYTYKQPSESPPLERRNINNKENFMSDVNEKDREQEDYETAEFWKKELAQETKETVSGEKARDPKEEAFLNTVHQRKVITDALKAGKLSCLPGEDGFADTTRAVNIVSGKVYHGTNLLFLKEHQKENGFPSAEYLPAGQIDKAHKDNPELFIRKGQKGVSVYVSEKNEETGEWENKSFRLFNVAQTTKPALMKEWAEQQRQEKLQEKLEYLQSQYGTGYTLPEPKQKGPGPEITCSSTEPKEYLGQYLAAVSLGGKFKVSKEQAAEFAQKLESTLFERMENGHTNPFKLEKISIEASQYCKEFLPKAQIEAQKAEQPEQKQEQAQSRGIGR